MTAPIIAGAEPWTSDGGDHGVLVLHGFTGSPHSLRALAEGFAAAGFTVDLPLLPGHGTAVEDMVPTRWPDWAAAAEEAYQGLAKRCSTVAVAGLSMGGALACRLVVDHPEIAALVLVNPIVAPQAPELRDGLQQLLEAGMEVTDGIGSDIAKEGVEELSYPGTPLAPLLSLLEGVEDLAPELGRIACPTLLFSSRQDHVVPADSGDLLERSAGGPVERIFLERSYHVATLDWDAPVIEKRAVAFVTAALDGPGDRRS